MPTNSQPSWLSVGTHVHDRREGRSGVVQLLQDARANVCVTGIERPSRALLRPVDRREPLWWAFTSDLIPAAGQGRDLGLGHLPHPLLGQRVVDESTGRVGVLRAICPEPEAPATYLAPMPHPGSGPPMAWLAPIGGGVEWTTSPCQISAAPPATALASRSGPLTSEHVPK